MIQPRSAGAGPRRCSFCDIFIFGGEVCPACGGQAVPASDPAPGPSTAKDLRHAQTFPVFSGIAGPKKRGLPTPQRTGRRSPPLARFIEATQRSVSRSPFLVFSIAAHLLLVALVATLVFTTVDERKNLPVYLSLHDRDDGPPGPGDGEDDRDEEPPPVQEEKAPEKPTEVAAPPPTPQNAPAPIGARPGPSPPSPENPKVPRAFGARSGKGKGEALQRYGGSHASEAAVLHGLAWLARHQDQSGKWSASGFCAHCREGELCSGRGRAYYDVGLTGLALLGYLGGGYTHREGPHADTVGRAISYLSEVQYRDGCFGAKLGNHMYNHAICTLAITEAYALTRDHELRRIAEKGLSYLVSAQQKGGGWDYTQMKTNRNDTSITGWAVMALKSAHSAGLRFPQMSWLRARRFLRKMTASDGRVRYADRGFIGFKGQTRYGIGMAAVGLLCGLYFGEPPGSPRMAKLAAKLKANPPDAWALRKERLHTYYYWYYATLALFHVGGNSWRDWNSRMRDFLIARQRRDGCAMGSFDPDDGWLGPHGGRVYTTVFAVLILEVYYRYLPLYTSKGPGLKEQRKAESQLALDEAAAAARSPDLKTGERLKAIASLGARPGVKARMILTELLADPKNIIRWKAAEVLGARKEPEAVPALVAALKSTGLDLATCYIAALARIGHDSAVPALVECLSSPDARVREKAHRALGSITGKKFGPDPGLWQAWRGGGEKK